MNYVELAPADPGGERPIIFVHGLAGCWQNWLEQLPEIGRARRVIALDLPGFGRSPMPSWDVSIPDYGRFLVRFAEAVEAPEAIVVGNSLGGYVTAEAVASEPGAFGGLVLVAAAGISHASMRPGPIALAGRLAVGLGPLMVGYQDAGIRRPALRDSAFRSVFHRPSALRPELLWEHYANGAGKPAFLPALTAMVDHDLNENLAAVGAPTLIVWGRDDRIIPVADATGYGEALPHAQTVILADTGHMPQVERPTRFNRLLTAFADGLSR